MIADIIHSIKNQLTEAYHDNLLAEQYAWWMLEAITGYSKTHLITHQNKTLTPEQNEQLNSWILQIKTTRIPLAYLIGYVPFLGLTIAVKPPVLIPRPETEEWVSTLIETLKRKGINNINILDLCTGTGCIALALAQAFPLSHVTAVDISEHAIRLAEHNAQKNNICNVTFIQSDLFEGIKTTASFDLIVANPPYIGDYEKESLDTSVTNWEDLQALFAPDNGLAIIKQIINQSPAYLKTHNQLCFSGIDQLYIEIGYKQGPVVKQYFEHQAWRTSTIHKDLEKNDRVVSGSL